MPRAIKRFTFLRITSSSIKRGFLHILTSMKTTGMTRRIDELGRIVIPKEIRRTLRLAVGEELEICVDNDVLTLKRYSPLSERKRTAKNVARALRNSLDAQIVITDLDKATVSSAFMDYEGRPLSDECKEIISKRETLAMENCALPIVCGERGDYTALTICPIQTAGDLLGGIVAFKESGTFDAKDLEIIKISAELLASEFAF